MNLGYAVYTVAAHYGKSGHVDAAVLNDGHGPYPLLVTGIAAADIDEEAAVYLLNNHVDAGDKALHHFYRPLLQCLRHDGVVRIGNHPAGSFPGRLPVHALLVNEDTHYLRYAESRMGIIDMDFYPVGELYRLYAFLQMMLHYALNAGGYEEVFLHQTQRPSFIGIVIGIEEFGDILHGIIVLMVCSHLLLSHDHVGLEVLVHLAVPQAESIDGRIVIADHRHIVRDSQYLVAALVNELQGAVLVLRHVGVAAEVDMDGFVRLAIFPGKGVFQPVVRYLYLISVENMLLKQTIAVTDTAAVARQAERCHRVNEAGSQTAEAAVAKTGIPLFGDKLLQLYPQLLQLLLYLLANTKVYKVCIQETPQKKFHGEIVDLLYPAVLVGPVCLDPVSRNILLHGSCQSLVQLLLTQVVQVTTVERSGRYDEPVLEVLHLRSFRFDSQ